jgi:hypothetical protein
LDNDSDEDPEIDVSANLTSRGISITHYTFPSKRQKMNPANSQVAKASPNVVSNIEATADESQNEKKLSAIPKAAILLFLYVG